MPDRHQSDEFIWALILSLIVNLLFVFALLAKRQGKNVSDNGLLVVSLEAQQSLSREESAAKSLQALPTLSRPSKDVLPTTPAALEQIVRNDTSLLQEVAVREDRGVLSAQIEGGVNENLSAPPLSVGIGTAKDKENPGDRTILEDKNAGENYNAAEFLAGKKPLYPKRAMRNGWEGTVVLNLSIDANGEVKRIEVAESSGYQLLDQQALTSVAAWRFKPARRNGIPVSTTVQQPVVFRPSSAEKSP